jgi:hypothetical protein
MTKTEELDPDLRDYLIESLVHCCDPEKLAAALQYPDADSMLQARGGSWEKLFFGNNLLGTMTEIRHEIELLRLGYRRPLPQW